MKTPTLINARHRRRPRDVTQGYSLYHALKDNGVPVKFIAIPYPDIFRRPVRQMDVLPILGRMDGSAFEMSSFLFALNAARNMSY